MKHVMFVITKSENGGAQKWVKEQTEILREEYKIYIVSDTNGWLLKNTKIEKFMICRLIRKRFSLIFLFKLIRFSKLHNIDLVIASSANAGLYARLLKLFYHTKVIYVSHGWSSIYNGGLLKFMYIFIERILSKLSDSVLCISKSDYRKAINEIGIKKNKLKMIYNNIFPMNIKQKIKNKKVKLLTVARLRYPKRVDLLIEAIINMKNIELYIVGGGPLMHELNEKAKGLRHIHFLGEVDSFSDYSSYDIFALISDSEGLPLSALEAMSSGLPLIVSNLDGCGELVDNNGALVDNDVEDIRLAIERVIKNMDIFGRNSKILFDKRFNLIKNKQMYISYYQDILKDQ